MKKLGICLLAVLLVMCAALPAGALASDRYTPATISSNPTFNKYLVIDSDASVPNLSFTYTIAPITQPIAAGENTRAVMPGKTNGGKPSVSTVTFAPGDSTSPGIANSAYGGSATADTTKKYATRTVTVDFGTGTNAVQFTEPGIYRYIITETANTTAGVVNDTETKRTLDVYVEDIDGSLSVVNTLLYHGEVTTGPGWSLVEPSGGGASVPTDTAAGDKSTGYVNTYETVKLTLSKKVTGNQGSRDKYFKFTIHMTDLGSGTVLTIDKSGAKATPPKTDATNDAYTADIMAAANNVTTWTAGASGESTGELLQFFYLSNDDSIVISGITKGAKYTITEAPEDYTASATVNSSDVTLADGSIPEQTMSSDDTVVFTNSKSGTIPTGVILNALPGVLIAAAGAAGLTAIGRKRRTDT